MNCIIALVFVTSTTGYSQYYNVAAGLRMGTEFGISVQGRIADKTTIEAIINTSLSSNRQSGTFLLEQHQSILTRRVNFYMGGGMHQSWTQDTLTHLPGGIAAIVGAEISLGKFNISWDYKPSVTLWGKEAHIYNGETAVTLRYVFWKIPKKKINWKFWEKKSK